MKPILYILCGPSGCGKSTWAYKFMYDNVDKDIRYVSRDEIRFSMLKDDEDYFAHEKEVFQKFVSTIAQTLIDGFDVIADATHLDVFSRRKLIYNVDQIYTDYEIIYVAFNTSVEKCLQHNNERTGRQHVPDDTIRAMCDKYRAPRMDEDKRLIDIIEVSD